MDKSAIRLYFLTLSELGPYNLFGELKDIGGADVPVGIKTDVLSAQKEVLVNKQTLNGIKVSKSINKKTLFNWQHRILTSLLESDNYCFTGITESDETFFQLSEKGKEPYRS